MGLGLGLNQARRPRCAAACAAPRARRACCRAACTPAIRGRGRGRGRGRRRGRGRGKRLAPHDVPVRLRRRQSSSRRAEEKLGEADRMRLRGSSRSGSVHGLCPFGGSRRGVGEFGRFSSRVGRVGCPKRSELLDKGRSGGAARGRLHCGLPCSLRCRHFRRFHSSGNCSRSAEFRNALVL